jgi:hypothetical protein
MTECVMDSVGHRSTAAACQQDRCGIFCEKKLPAPVREVLRLTREAQPDRDVICVAFRTHENGREVARIGPMSDELERVSSSASRHLRPKDVIVLSVVVTETTFETVHTSAHVLVARTERRARADPG